MIRSISLPFGSVGSMGAFRAILETVNLEVFLGTSGPWEFFDRQFRILGYIAWAPQRVGSDGVRDRRAGTVGCAGLLFFDLRDPLAPRSSFSPLPLSTEFQSRVRFRERPYPERCCVLTFEP